MDSILCARRGSPRLDRSLAKGVVFGRFHASYVMRSYLDDESETEQQNVPRAPIVTLLDVRQDSIQLIQAVVAHHQLALATGGMLDGDLRAELVSELLLEALDVRVTAVLAFRG